MFNEEFDTVTESIKKMDAAGRSSWNPSKALADQTAHMQDQLDDLPEVGHRIMRSSNKPSKANWTALQAMCQVSMLHLLRQETMHKEILSNEWRACNKAQDVALMNTSTQLDTLHESSGTTQELSGFEEDKYLREKTHVQDAMQKWEAYATTVGAAHGTVSVIANQAIQSLNNELAVLQKQEAAAKNLSTIGLKGTGKYKDDQAEKTLSETFDTPKPAYGGTKETEELFLIQTKSNAATAEAAKLFTATRTESEQYAEQLDVLNALLARGAISQNTYDRELEDLKVKLGQGGMVTASNTSSSSSIRAAIRPKMQSSSWIPPLRALRTISRRHLATSKAEWSNILR